MNTKPSGDAGASDWLVEEDFPGQTAAQPSAPPWRVLIVDDDVDVHVVTKFSLSNTNFRGRRLSFLHAYSGAEALAMLRNTPDIALVLLDVIMETPDAGLRVARQIRDELGNHSVRIVLRTGQPGQVMEQRIILDYDINDFWSKADLTTRKLFTTVISSLRSYASLKANERDLAALNAALAQERRVLASLEQGILFMSSDQNGKLIEINDNFCTLLEYRREEMLGHSIRFHEDQYHVILERLATGQPWTGDVTVYARDGKPHALRALFVAQANDGTNAARHRLFATLAGPGLDRHPVVPSVYFGA